MRHEFFGEINFPEALELVAEKFDNAVDLIGSNAVVYGGALRDLIAGFPLTSDLDIACDYNEYKQVVRRFNNSEKWITGSDMKKLRGGTSNDLFDNILNNLSQRKNSYENIPISSVTDFYTCNNVKIQLMRAASAADGEGSAVDIVKNVDIVCCGLMMDAAGRIFEVVKGAYRDCVNKVLNLNEGGLGIDIKALESRISKLEERGWISKINLRKLARNAKKLEESKNKYMQKMAKRKGKRGWVDFIKTEDAFRVRIHRKLLNAYIGFGLPAKHVEELMDIAKTYCDLSIKHTGEPGYKGKPQKLAYEMYKTKTKAKAQKLMHEVYKAKAHRNLSDDIETGQDYITKIFPTGKMSSLNQMKMYEAKLQNLVDECRYDTQKNIYNKKDRNLLGKVQLGEKKKRPEVKKKYEKKNIFSLKKSTLSLDDILLVREKPEIY